MSMQTLILGIQNSLEFKDMGAGTSTATFFRSMGGSFGVAVMGTVLNNGLSSEIQNRLPAAIAQLPPEVAKQVAAQMGGGFSIAAPAVIARMPTPVREAIENALIAALNPVFVIGAAVCAVGVLLALGMPDLKLRGGPAAVSAMEGAGEAMEAEVTEEPAPARSFAAVADQPDEDADEESEEEESEEEVENDNARAQSQTETLL
jgi:hypothetical protein